MGLAQRSLKTHSQSRSGPLWKAGVDNLNGTGAVRRKENGRQAKKKQKGAGKGPKAEEDDVQVDDQSSC
jgi:hypothetical protein